MKLARIFNKYGRIFQNHESITKCNYIHWQKSKTNSFKAIKKKIIHIPDLDSGKYAQLIALD